MDLPSAEVEPERYRGRPLLAVLENYVLAAIGELSPDRHAGIGRIVREGFGGLPGEWMQTVRQRLGLNEKLDDVLRQKWENSQAAARRSGLVLHPVQFAKMVADQNFAELIGPPASDSKG